MDDLLQGPYGFLAALGIVAAYVAVAIIGAKKTGKNHDKLVTALTQLVEAVKGMQSDIGGMVNKMSGVEARSRECIRVQDVRSDSLEKTLDTLNTNLGRWTDSLSGLLTILQTSQVQFMSDLKDALRDKH
jgi:hypothetical protein